MEQVGFIGLGKMGLPMVRSLSRNAEIVVRAFDTQEEPFGVLAGDPAYGTRLLRAGGLSELGACSVVITMLPSSVATNAVIEGGEGAGLMDLMSPGSTLIDMGSSNPAETQRLAEVLATRGIQLVDAPVSGSVAKAGSGTLSIMAGCDEATLARLRFVFDFMGEEVFATGRTGSAHALKALNNYVYAAGLLAVSEAALIAERLELDVPMLARVLNSSSGRNIASETKLVQFIHSRAYNGGFSLRLQAKDLATAASLQGMAGLEAELLGLCNRVWSEAISAMPLNADNTEIHSFLSQRSEDA